MKITKIINISFKEIFLSKRRRLLISLGILASVAVTAVLILFFGGKDTLAAWFDESWAFRRRIPVTNNATAETNVYVTIANIDTSDTAKFQADCGDIRFTKENGQLLDYYIVSGCGTATTTLHVQFDTLIAGLQDIYMYYGNPSAANGFATSDFSTQASNYSVGSLASEEKGPGPVLYFAFDEGYGTSTKDASSNEAVGTFSGTGGPTWKPTSECIVEKCLYFNGSDTTNNQTVTLSQSANSPQNITGDVTISAWIRPTSNYFDTSGAILRNGQGANLVYSLFYDYTNKRVSLQWYDGTFKSVASTTNSVEMNKWTHVQLKREGSTIYVYLDGKLNNSGASTTPTVPSTQLAVGRTNNVAVPQDYTGFVDELKVYNYARSAAQIKADYASRGSTKGAAVLLGDSSEKWLSDGLVGYWKMNEASWNGTANEVVDSSGNGNHGTAVCNTSRSPGCSVPSTTTGKFGNAGSTDDTNSKYIAVGDKDILEVGTTTSVSGFAWISPTADAKRAIVNKRDGNCSEGYNFYRNSTGTIELNAAENSVNYTTTSTTSVPSNTWSFVGFVIDRATKKATIYINGQPSGTPADITNMGDMTNTCTFNIAAWGPLGNLFWDGYLDETRIYNRALSPNEVRDLYKWAPGPTAYWNFDEKTGTNLYDRSGNGNNSTAFSGSPAWVSGKYGGALDFNGTTGNVTVPIFNPKNITVEGWFYRDALDATNADAILGGWYWVSDGQLRQGYDLRFFINQSTLNWVVETTNGSTVSEVSVNSSTLNTGQWYHAAGTYDSTSGKSYLYINGVLSGSATGTAGNTIVPQTQYADMRIGYSRVNNGYFDGKVDDLRIYNYARTAKQIVEDMNAGHPTVGSPVSSAVGYWKFDEGYGNTTYNSGAGTGINGTITGATWSTAGKFGKALNFSGTSSYVDMGNTSPLQITSDLTISSWIYLSSIDPTYARGIVSKFYNTNGNRGYRLGITNSTGLLSFAASNDGTTSVQVTGNTAIPTNSWTYVSAVYRASAGAVDFYINGKLDTTKTGLATSIYNVGQNFQIGTWDTGTSAHSFVGLIDDPKIYNYALTSDEIKLDYNHGAALVMGATSTDSSGNPDNSSAREYCIPGDTTSCSAPVAEWKMDEKTGTNAYDTSGNGNTAVLASGANQPTWSAGKIGSSLGFDGGDYTTITNNSTLQPTSAITVEAWAKMNSFTDSWLVSNQKSTYDANFGYELREDTLTNGFLFRVGNGTTSSSRASATGLATGVWYHVVGVFDGSNAFIYLNGVGSTGGALTGPIDYTGVASSMYIGQRSDNAFRTNGYIDNVKIFNYARTPAQIAWDYNRGGPVGHWKFDECQGSTANDSSGNSLSGTIATATSLGTCTSSAGDMWKDGATGRFNSSLDFDATVSDNVQVADNTTLRITDELSVCSWVKSAQTSMNGGIFEKTVGGVVNTSYLMFAEGSVYKWRVKDATGLQTLSSLTTLSTLQNSWAHICGTFSKSANGAAVIYINGKSDNSTNFRTTSASTGAGISLIGVLAGAVYPYNGQIDDVRVYNYALTSTQIRTLYNDGAVRYGPATGSP